MDFSGLCLELGLGAAVGMLAGSTGLEGSARGRMTLLAAAIGFVVGVLVSGFADVDALPGAIACLVGAVIACVIVSDVVHGAGRREGGGGGALGFLVSLAALVVVGVTVAFHLLALVVLALLLWLGLARHRRTQRKHAGLRVLR